MTKQKNAVEEAVVEVESPGLNLDLSVEEERIPIIPEIEEESRPQLKAVKKETSEEVELISCLRNEKVIVRFIPKETGLISNPKHIFYGGMSETAFRKFTVPRLESSGIFVNVLTNSEKTFLEQLMGLEHNALSIYLKQNNYWTNFTVRLVKGDNYLDLSVPDDYIKYKVLLSNRDFIVPSLAVLQENPKVTYQYVIVNENDEVKANNKELTASMEAFLILGKILEEKEKLRFIIETIEGRPISEKTELDVLQSKLQKLIKANAKLFVSVAKDQLLDSKVLLKDCITYGLVRRRGDFLYLAEDNSPLCNHGEDPTINVAAKFINLPKSQQIKITLEAKLKQAKVKE